MTMNKTHFDNEAREDGFKAYRETLSLFLKGLGAYFSITLTSISFLIIFSLFLPKTQTGGVSRLLPYTGFTVIFLLLYSIATTKTRGGSKTYKFLQILKRFLDLVITSFSFFAMMPLLILIMILIKVDSAGPVIFRTKRVGQFGKTFDVYKFRTFAPSQKPITRVGKFLRRFSLDRLPMYYNVLEGELSLVGPRPRSPEYFVENKDIDRKILTVRPGVTGLAQISRASSPQQLVELELEYVEKWSLFLDFKIFLKTPFAVLMNE